MKYTYEIVLDSNWGNIKKGEKVYVEYDGNTNGLKNKLNSNSQFSSAQHVKKVKGDYLLQDELGNWLSLSY